MTSNSEASESQFQSWDKQACFVLVCLSIVEVVEELTVVSPVLVQTLHEMLCVWGGGRGNKMFQRQVCTPGWCEHASL